MSLKSRFNEMFGTIDNPKYNSIKVKSLVSTSIERVSNRYHHNEAIKYIDISSIDRNSRRIVSITNYLVQEAPSRAQQCVQYGDVLISNVRPNLNTTCIVDYKDHNLVCSTGFTVLRCVHCTPAYLLTAISSNDFVDNLMSLASGSSYPAVTTKDVLNQDIPDAPVELQNQFSTFVEQIYKSKLVLRKLISKYDELIKSRFVELLKLPHFETTLGKVCKITDGSHYSPKNEPGGTIPMLSVKDVRLRGFDYSGCKFISNEEYSSLKKSGCKPLLGDVLIAKDGATAFKKGFVLKEEIEQAVLSSIAIIRPDQSVVNSEYLKTYLLSDYIYKDVTKNHISGTAITRVVLKELKNISIKLPSIDDQNQFAAFVEQVDKSKYPAVPSRFKLSRCVDFRPFSGSV